MESLLPGAREAHKPTMEESVGQEIGIEDDDPVLWIRQKGIPVDVFDGDGHTGLATGKTRRFANGEGERA